MASNSNEADKEYWENVRLGVRKCVSRLRGKLDEADVEDIEQEAMLNAVKYANFEGRSKPSTWGFSIARHAVIKFLKDRKEQESAIHSVGIIDDHLDPAYSDEHEYVEIDNLDALPDAGLEALAQEIKDRMIRNASRKWIQHIVAKDLHGLSHIDIALKYNCKLGTVLSSVHRARRLMKPKLQALIDCEGSAEAAQVVKRSLVLLNDWLLTGS